MINVCKKGFTLIEILIVIAIVGIIAAIAIPNILSSVQKSKRSRAMADMKAIMSAMGSYMSATRTSSQRPELPDELIIADFLPEEYYGGATKDPWGGDYIFTRGDEGNAFILISYGKDQVAGAGTDEFDSDIIYKNGQFSAPRSVSGK